MRFLALLILGLVTAPAEPLPVAPSAVGFRALEVPGIEAVAWYPTLQTAPVTTVAGNKIFVGVSVVRDAPIAGAAHPVALLSHGYSGLWRNQAWLAEHLARAGFIAVALNQPGTTFGDMDPDWGGDLALRPQQVSRVLDALLADPHLGPRIDDARISVVGHSLGGSTALLLSGGLFDPSLLVEACGEDRDKLLCTLYRAGGLTKAMAPVSARDPRISAAVLLDMEGIHAFTPAMGIYRSECRKDRLHRVGIEPIAASDFSAISNASVVADVAFDALGGDVATGILERMREKTDFVAYGLLTGKPVLTRAGIRARYHRFHMRDHFPVLADQGMQSAFAQIWPLLEDAPPSPARVFPAQAWREALSEVERPGGQKPILDLTSLG